jgi:hypothetical protein
VNVNVAADEPGDDELLNVLEEELGGADGVPPITPAGLSVSPGGSVPLNRLHVRPGIPPVADSVVEYDTPGVAIGKVGGVVTVSKPPTRIVNVLLVVWAGKPLSLTWIVKLVPAVFAAVGVPPNVPFANVIPGGRVPTTV